MNKKKFKDIFIKTYYGFGDNIWMYPFVKEASKKYSTIYLETSYPFLYHSLSNIKFLRPMRSLTLKTCKAYIKSYPKDFWAERPTFIKQLNIPYYLSNIKRDINLMDNFNQAIHIEDKFIDFNLPLHPQWVTDAQQILSEIKTDKKICIIRPPSDRSDWSCPARAPKPEYFQYFIDKYAHEYYFISIGNRETDRYIQELKNIDLRFENGELPLTTIVGLASLVDLIITYNCFLFPLGLAVKTKTLVIGGGFSNPHLYVNYDRMDLSNLQIVAPDNPCNCINRKHKCNKDISFSKLEEGLKKLVSSSDFIPTPAIIKPKKNILISRMRAERCHTIANNKLIQKHFNIYTVDHTQAGYNNYRNEFVESYFFPSVGDVCRPMVNEKLRKDIYNMCKGMIQKNRIDMVINAQPLHPYNEIMAEACRELKIQMINSETFCDDKWLFDYVGCQYVCPNEIYDYVNKMPIKSEIEIDLPKTTRQPQPPTIEKDYFFKKYNLDPNGKYIVILGQLLWDMSVKRSVNINIRTYEEYLDLILKANPDTTFLVKFHPIYNKGRKKKEMDFIYEYPNVKVIDENIITLFKIFNNYTSFSSTTIFEGLLYDKKFATLGFHYCNNDELVIQLRVNDRAKNLYNQLENFRIDQTVKNRYLRFVCNYYTIDLNSDKLYYRLVLPSDKYFKLLF